MLLPPSSLLRRSGVSPSSHPSLGCVLLRWCSHSSSFWSGASSRPPPPGAVHQVVFGGNSGLLSSFAWCAFLPWVVLRSLLSFVSCCLRPPPFLSSVCFSLFLSLLFHSYVCSFLLFLLFVLFYVLPFSCFFFIGSCRGLFQPVGSKNRIVNANVFRLFLWFKARSARKEPQFHWFLVNSRSWTTCASCARQKDTVAQLAAFVAVCMRLVGTGCGIEEESGHCLARTLYPTMTDSSASAGLEGRLGCTSRLERQRHLGNPIGVSGIREAGHDRVSTVGFWSGSLQLLICNALVSSCSSGLHPVQTSG